MARLLTLTALLLLSGCASLPEGTQRSEDDPWERYNRAMYQFNDAVDSAVLKPVAKGYRYVTPDPVEQGISNFFSNLALPLVAINQFLQGDFGQGASDIGRFLLNSTLGVGGFFDPASDIGLVAESEDFGQTLAVWGVPSGPYVQLPFLGPSTLRDAFGTYADSQADPLYQHIHEPEKYYLIALNIVQIRAQLLSLDDQLQGTFDPYTFMRDAYLQRREFMIHDGNPPLEEDYYDDIYGDFEDFEDPADESIDDGPVADPVADEAEEEGADESGMDESGGEQ